jgi:hypothetical protein
MWNVNLQCNIIQKLNLTIMHKKYYKYIIGKMKNVRETHYVNITC